MQDTNKPKKSRVGLIILLLLIIGAVVVIIINPFTYLQQFRSEQMEQQSTTNGETILSVDTAEVVSGDLRSYIETNGNVVDTDTLDVYPEVSGKLTYLGVKTGDLVEEGNEVARIDPSRPGITYRVTSIDSPVKGTVMAVNFPVGSTVAPQMALMRIGMLGNPEVEVSIAERHIGQVDVGAEVVATFKAYPDRQFIGTVVRMDPVLDPVTRTLVTGISLEDPENLIKVGMFPSVRIYTGKVENVTVIDRSAILYDGEQAYVFLYQEGFAVRQSIKLGLVVEQRAEVVEGLSPGDEVIVRGQTLVTDGVSVQMVD